MPTLICDCNKTMPLDPRALGKALAEDLTLHSTLCRREAGAFLQAARGSKDDVLVACTQEKRLFAELAREPDEQGRVPVAPIRFVNIRETGGWSRDARGAMPKLAALIALAQRPQPEPVPTVTYRSAGRLLVIGPLEAAERFAAAVGDVLDVTIFSRGGNGTQERRFPVVSGKVEKLDGWLGAFALTWSQDNPIDLDLCTRCNACVAACPEGAIGFDYQVNLGACRSHRDCVKACDVAGAIDFTREPVRHDETFDLVLDLRREPQYARHAPPQGWFHVPPGEEQGAKALDTILKLRDLVGEFEKPKFFTYKQKLCAHSRNEQVGCRACIDVCSAEAISSEKSRQQVKVNPNLCVGCGACTTVCPTGAMSYAYPKATEQADRIRTALITYAKAGGERPVVLLHAQERGGALVEDLGRAARVRKAHGVPANVIPVALWHPASVGIDNWLLAVAQGAAQVAVLVTGEEAPQYVDALQAQMAVAQSVLAGLGYRGTHVRLVRAGDVATLDAALQSGMVGEVPRQPATFGASAEKRTTLDTTLDHLVAFAPRIEAEAIALPGVAPWGTVAIDADKCTLCMSCVGACPVGALQDNPDAPQLRFVEKNCVQCGLCVSTCPEQAVSLQPRLLANAQRKLPRVVNESQPWGCVRCGKPFGTAKGVEAMLSRLAGHAMFQGAALERLKMCGDCRVVDLYSATDESKITDA